MNFLQRLQHNVISAANTALPYVMNATYIIGGFLFAPNVRQMFDTAVDYYSNYSINPNTAAYTIAREAVGYLGTPILLKAGALLAQKASESVINLTSELLERHRARANARTQERPEYQTGPDAKEMPDFSKHPDYKLMKRFKTIIDTNPQTSEFVYTQTNLKILKDLFQLFRAGDNMTKLEQMNQATQTATFKEFVQRNK